MALVVDPVAHPRHASRSGAPRQRNDRFLGESISLGLIPGSHFQYTVAGRTTKTNGSRTHAPAIGPPGRAGDVTAP